MALSTTERIIVDGVDVRTLAKYLPRSASGTFLSAPGRRGSNVAAVGRHGTLWTPGKTFEENVFTLSLIVLGADDDGRIPNGSTARRELYTRIDELMALFTKGYGLLNIQHVLPDGSMREIAAEMTRAVNWAVNGPQPRALVEFELRAPSPFWASTTAFSTVMAPATATAVAPGATAPLDDGVFTITGPITNPRINDVASGAAFTYGATLSASQTLTVNAGTWALSSTGGASTSLALVTFTGTGGRLMRLQPDPAARGYRASLTGTQTSAATRLAVTGRAKYLTG